MKPISEPTKRRALRGPSIAILAAILFCVQASAQTVNMGSEGALSAATAAPAPTGNTPVAPVELGNVTARKTKEGLPRLRESRSSR